jgi:cytochrome c oxidase assembly protein subunit 19
MSVMNFQPAFRDVKPPEKGSFPLDHEAECKDFMARYMRCLRENQSNNSLCRLQAKDYLQCRMDRNLMAKEDWSKLGYNDILSGNFDNKKSATESVTTNQQS